MNFHLLQTVLIFQLKFIIKKSNRKIKFIFTYVI